MDKILVKFDGVCGIVRVVGKNIKNVVVVEVVGIVWGGGVGGKKLTVLIAGGLLNCFFLSFSNHEKLQY